jgi:hypothetical protein
MVLRMSGARPDLDRWGLWSGLWSPVGALMGLVVGSVVAGGAGDFFGGMTISATTAVTCGGGVCGRSWTDTGGARYRKLMCLAGLPHHSYGESGSARS